MCLAQEASVGLTLQAPFYFYDAFRVSVFVGVCSSLHLMPNDIMTKGELVVDLAPSGAFTDITAFLFGNYALAPDRTTQTISPLYVPSPTKISRCHVIDYSHPSFGTNQLQRPGYLAKIHHAKPPEGLLTKSIAIKSHLPDL